MDSPVPVAYVRPRWVGRQPAAVGMPQQLSQGESCMSADQPHTTTMPGAPAVFCSKHRSDQGWPTRPRDPNRSPRVRAVDASCVSIERAKGAPGPLGPPRHLRGRPADRDPTAAVGPAAGGSVRLGDRGLVKLANSAGAIHVPVDQTPYLPRVRKRGYAGAPLTQSSSLHPHPQSRRPPLVLGRASREHDERRTHHPHASI